MAEAAAAGVLPHHFWDYTYRELHAVLDGQQKRRNRDMQLALWAAWQNQNLARHKRLPPIVTLLRKLEPVRVMSAKAIRGAVRAMAKAMGADFRTVKKGDL